MRLHGSISIAAIAGLIAAAYSVAVAAETPQIDSRVQGALEHFYAQSDANRELANRAAAVLVFPHVTEPEAAPGGESGEGALEIDGKTIGYYKISVAAVGAQAGVARRSEVFLFMTHEALAGFMRSSDWTVGADTGVAIAQQAAGAQYQGGAIHEPVLAFVFGESGPIGDASLEGTQVTKLPE